MPARRLSPRKRKAEPEKDGKTDPETKDKSAKEIDIDDASKSRKDRAVKRPRQNKKTPAVPMIMDDDDDDDLKILEDKRDKTYEPEEEEDDMIYPMDDNDD